MTQGQRRPHQRSRRVGTLSIVPLPAHPLGAGGPKCRRGPVLELVRTNLAYGQLMKWRMLIGVAGLALVTAAPAFSQDAAAPTPPVLDDHALLQKYVWSTLGPSGALHATLASSFEQWRRSPPDWSMDEAGYAQRWASVFVESAIGSTTKYGVARLLHHDPSFVKCTCTGFGPRLRYAVTSPFAARTVDGRRVFSPATVAGLAAENIVPASTWYPAPRGTRDGLAHAASGVLAKVGVDVVREFVSRRSLRRTP